MEDNGGQKIQTAIFYTRSEGMYWIQMAHNYIQLWCRQKIYCSKTPMNSLRP